MDEVQGEGVGPRGNDVGPLGPRQSQDQNFVDIQHSLAFTGAQVSEWLRKRSSSGRGREVKRGGVGVYRWRMGHSKCMHSK